ncbi:SPRY domain-containing SOCS box protein 3 [Frankliniella fusca]|uniref:SPRY domain-containing SOCS box protein 3 n=1 Tax=Frankliniella fusca TaxID=407009 RepID=A0AAE1GYD4_9NEOP|nr:SPRY domain-containing SOCS box protein 3 [Frankliniella fusca]
MDVTSSFCDCESDLDNNVKCQCGEEFDANEWWWEHAPCDSTVRLSCNQRGVLFNPVYSVGTAAVRGTMPLIQGRQYLWEIKMLSSIHGTDVVVGIGTANVDLTAHSRKFITLVGNDSESWGYSYRGDVIHNNNRRDYGPTFGKGSIVGVHLNMWTGCGIQYTKESGSLSYDLFHHGEFSCQIGYNNVLGSLT